MVIEVGRWIKDKEGGFTYSPYSLVFYEKERDWFGEAYGKKLNELQVTRVFKKLKRHYKIPHWLVINRKRSGGCCNRYRIELGKEPSLGLLIHEVAHAVDFKKRRSRHDKKFKKVMQKVFNYCKKKNWWEKELGI